MLWLIQSKNDEDFDGYHYTSLMREICRYLYELPMSEEDLMSSLAKTEIKKGESKLSDCPMDELFMWSILIFSGKEEDSELIKYYWSLTSKPITCALAAVCVYNRLMKKNFVNREFKESIKKQTEYSYFIYIFILNLY